MRRQSLRIRAGVRPGLAFVLASTAVVGQAPQTAPSAVSSNPGRVLNFENHCDETVWIGFAGGAGDTCQTDADCQTNQVCVTSGSRANTCFWVLTTPDTPHGAAWDLGTSASDHTATVTLDATPSSQSVAWNGAIFGRTGCDANGQSCATADCSADGSGECDPTVGAVQPATQLEMTLFNDAPDGVIDLEVINGFNLSLEMAPDAPPSTQQDYVCGNPGGETPLNPGLSGFGCSWQFDPTFSVVDPSTGKTVKQDWSVQMQNVAPTSCSSSEPCPGSGSSCVSIPGQTTGTCSCSVAGDCGSGEVCGQAWVNLPSVFAGLRQSCGEAAGWWAGVKLCTLAPDFGAPFYCSASVPSSAGAYGTMANLYGCQTPSGPAESCYSNGATSTCCGCATESDGWPPATTDCQSTNPFWHDQSPLLPTVQFFKEACPTAYTYQYDDTTSSFSCTNAATPNQNTYTITFCPDQPAPTATRTRPSS